MPGQLADAVTLKKDRLFWPPGRYDASPVLDVLLDRASAVDVDSVVINGQVVLRSGRFTTVDEAAVRTELAEAVQRAYARTPEGDRFAALGAAAEAVLGQLYEPWYELPVQPASVYNTRVAPSPEGA